MYIARWHIDARFGYKQKLLGLMQRWLQEVGPQAGVDKMQPMLSTGSIGAQEATIYVDHRIESLAQLDEMFAKLAKNDAHQKWGTEIEPFVVSGSSRWEILRVL